MEKEILKDILNKEFLEYDKVVAAHKIGLRNLRSSYEKIKQSATE